MQMVHDFDNYKYALSEGAALAIVVQAVPGNPHGTGVSRVLNNTGKRDCPRRRPPLARRRSRRTRGGGSGGSAPPFLTSAAAPASVHRRTRWRTVNTPRRGVAPSTVIPGGKAEMLKAWTRVVLLNLALTAAGLRASGSGKTMPCLANSRLSMVGFVCPRNQGRYRWLRYWSGIWWGLRKIEKKRAKKKLLYDGDNSRHLRG